MKQFCKINGDKQILELFAAVNTLCFLYGA